MMFRNSCWPILFAALLLSSSVALAQDDETTGEEPEAVEETEAVEEEEPDEAPADAGENEEEVDEAEEVDEPEEIEPTPDVDEPADEPVEEPVEQEMPGFEETVEEPLGEEDGFTDEEPYLGPAEDPMHGAAISPARPSPETGVLVRGNVRDDSRLWSLKIGGYIRAGYRQIQADPDVELFGRNDGFVLYDARLITQGSMNNGLGFVFSLDAGSRLIRTTPDSPVEELTTRMADTYAYYRPTDFLEFNIGQFKAPYDAEDLISASSLLFVDRSVANRGVQNVEGFNVEGLGQGRQVGLQARGNIFPLASDSQKAEGPGVSYAAAVVNGNGANRSLNNNDRLAYFGRLVLHWEDMVALGGGAFHNDNTFGDPPNQVDRLIWGWTADLQVKAYGVTLLANVLSQSRETPDIEQDPEVTAMGYQVQVAYEEPFFGLQPAYRFAFYDPTFQHQAEGDDLFFDNDARTHHTIGLNYNADDYPLRLMANYTIALEEEAVRLDNNRLDLLVQLQW